MDIRRLNIFLLLTVMLSALTGVGRAAEARVPAGVEACRAVALTVAVAPVGQRVTALRPDGYVAPAPLLLDLRLTRDVASRQVPERRRE